MKTNSERRQSQIIDTLFISRNVDELRDYIGNHPDIELLQLTDSQGNTLLHQLAYEGQFQIIQLLVEEVHKLLQRKALQKGVYYSKYDNKQITNWMNIKNNEGFTPILYASYSGHINIIKFMVEKFNVNQEEVTNTGLNVLHLAAQKCMVMPFLYFRGKISLEIVDDLKSTPLHWAAYMNSEQVVAYLLSESQFRGINWKDKQGNTPLMLAVSYGNTRIVRRLLMKGANRLIKNNEDKTPLQVAIQSQFKSIQKMLSTKYSFMDLIKFYCNVKIEYRPKSRSYTIPMVFIMALVVNLAIINICIQFSQLYFLIGEAIIMGIMFILYLTLLFSTPKSSPRQYSDIIGGNWGIKIKKICFQCKNIVQKRGYHCDICKVCIKQYDHHCTWINNCVGKKNISRFIFFLLFLIICLGFIGLISTLASFSLLIDDLHRQDLWFDFRFQQIDNVAKYCLLGMLLINQLSAIFIFPVFLLFIVQIRNLLVNKTTFQNIRGPTEEQRQIKDKMRKYNKASLRNCRVMCADNRSSFLSNRTSFVNDLITQKFVSETQES